jgi:beta-glucosidase
MHYLNQHLCAIRTAIERGVNVRGYMAWSLMDNFEWSQGYAKRFGIVHVDFETLERTPKDTARYYSKIIETNGGVLDDPFLPISLHTRHG